MSDNKTKDGFVRTVPESSPALLKYLTMTYEQQGHVVSIMVRKDKFRIEVRLDDFAHHNSVPFVKDQPDIYIPLKTATIEQAAQQVDGLWLRAKDKGDKKGTPPTKEECDHLFELIDTSTPDGGTN